MKTNLSADFDKLARSAINNEATDAQLEQLELAIMESAEGADVFRDMVESDAAAAIQETAVRPALVARGKAPLTLVKVLFFSSMAAAAAIVMLVGTGLLYFALAKGLPHSQQVAATSATQVSENTLSNDDDGTVLVAPIATDSVPEPSTSLLFMMGLSFALLRRRR